MYKFGFIGVGHMGKTLAKAVMGAEGAGNVAVCDADTARAEKLALDNGCAILTAGEIAERCRYIFLGVKPQNMAELLRDIGPVLKARGDYALVTMAAGITTGGLCDMLGANVPVMRIMPNTPAAVGEGCILYTGNTELTVEDSAAILEGLRLTGQLVETPERLIDAGCAISGCGPAFVYRFIIALKEAGEGVGLDGKTALKLAEQTVLGAAKLAISSGEDPEVLCGQVCSPGGSTIEGVKVMKTGGFDSEVKRAVRASFERTVELGKGK